MADISESLFYAYFRVYFRYLYFFYPSRWSDIYFKGRIKHNGCVRKYLNLRKKCICNVNHNETLSWKISILVLSGFWFSFEMHSFLSAETSVWFGENPLSALNSQIRARHCNVPLPAWRSRRILAIMGKIVKLSRPQQCFCYSDKPSRLSKTYLGNLVPEEKMIHVISLEEEIASSPL